ncbi:MAG: M23 family metallopeptidase [Alphaproteobacteria bacterium]|nr:M23 family metallopeptidase [Alphaproteobacteria bacterium]
MRRAFYIFSAALFAGGIVIAIVVPAPVTGDPGEDAETPVEVPTVTFPFEPSGTLVAGSGTGIADETQWAADMRFPIELAEAYANSQVYGAGGMYGPAGGQCAASNYSYPWHDNFCETRDRTNIFCPAGKGHQGQDIRPATCEKGKYWAVAAEPGQITAIGSYTVTLTADSGLIYRYLHLDMARLAVKQGDTVTKGQHIGYVSNDFGGSVTTIHLHFEIKANVIGADGQPTITFVSPYMSLVRAYERLLTEEAKATPDS